MDQTRAHKIAGVAGLFFATLSLIVIPLTLAPESHGGAATSATVLGPSARWYQEHRSGFLLGNYLGLAAFFPGFVQLAVLYAVIRKREGATGWLSILVFGCGTFAYAVFGCSLVLFQTMPFVIDPTAPQATRALSTLSMISFALDGLAAAPAAAAQPAHPTRATTTSAEVSTEPGARPIATEIHARRYRCRACAAILVVVPRGVGRGYRYSLSTIAWALALWAYERLPAADVRARSSTAKRVGAASATRWASLRRWTRCALKLFGIEADELGTIRARATRIAIFVASHTPIATGPVPHDAFCGAAFCPSC
jgi:hypothetical protein